MDTDLNGIRGLILPSIIVLGLGNCAPPPPLGFDNRGSSNRDFEVSWRLRRDGFCLVDNNACHMEDNEFLESPRGVFNQLGCQQRCHDHALCEWWTWYEAGEWDSEPGLCQLFQSCALRNDSCSFCYTGHRSCYLKDEQQASAVIGGISLLNSVNKVDVFESFGLCSPGLVADIPVEWARWSHASATVGNFLYVCGGKDESEIKRSCLSYDIINRKWEIIPDMRHKRRGAKAIETYGELYVIGGENGTHVVGNIEIYNYEQHSWRELETDMPHPRADHCIVRHKDGIYVLGGRAANGEHHEQGNVDPQPMTGLVTGFEMFNTTTGQWFVLTAPNQSRTDHACVLLAQGLLVAGGRDEQGTILRSVDFYDLETHLWELRGEMLNARYAFGLTAANNTVTAVGGHNGVVPLKSAETFSLESDEWTLFDSLELTSARSQFSMSTIPLGLLPEAC